MKFNLSKSSRIISVVLSGLLLMGCAGNTTAKTPATAQTPATETPAAETTATDTPANQTQDKKEIEFWHALGGDLGNQMKATIEEFNNSNERYEVKEVTLGSYSEIDTKLQAAFASKVAPNLVAGGSGFMFHAKGLVEPFEKHLSADFDKEDILGGLKNYVTINGEMVFAPAYATSQILYYNKKVLAEAGKTEEDLKSWQSLVGMSNDVIGINTGNNKIEFVWEPMSGSGNMIDAINSAGGRIVSDDGQTVTINTEPWVDVLDSFRKWIHEDKIMSIHTGGQGWEYWYKTMDDWVYGKSLGYTGSPGDFVIARDAITEVINNGVKNEFGVAPQPGWKGNAPRPYYSSLLYYLPKTDKDAAYTQGAVDFVEYALRTENTAKFAIATGYIPVRKSVLELDIYKEFLKTSPGADVPLKQVDQSGAPAFIDPTGGAIFTIIGEAVEKIQVENAPVQATLDEANARAQKELDKVK